MSKSTNRVIVRKIAASSPYGATKQLPNDPFHDMYEDGVIEPLYDPEILVKLPENSNILQQCVDAYKNNIPGFGYAIRYKIDYDSKDTQDAIKKAAEEEWQRMDSFLKYVNFDEPFSDIMKKVIDDREKIGYGCLEVIPDGLNNPAGLEHIEAHTVRIGKTDNRLIEVEQMILTDKGYARVKRKRRFRKFVQIKNSKKVWFKEFGDPRQMDCETGEYGENIPEEKQSNALMFFRIHCSYSPYGIPRYIGNLINVYGSRKAEELNYKYFEDGRHIPLAVLVKNGVLSEYSVNELKNKGKGIEDAYKYLILEAEGYEDDSGLDVGGDKKQNNVDIELKPLAEMLNNDALYQEYDEKTRNKIRSSFRLAPIYTGDSQDYNRATADTARQVTEEQVFVPERDALAFYFNNALLPILDLKYVEMYFKGPQLSNKSDIAKALHPYIAGGAATPNALIDALGELLGKSFEQIEEDWANKPLAIVLKEMDAKSRIEQLKNVAVEKSADEERETVLSVLKSLQLTIEEVLGCEE